LISFKVNLLYHVAIGPSMATPLYALFVGIF
jgi:hypothetical protein